MACSFQFTLYRPAQGRTFVAVPPGVAFDDADNGNARSPEFETPVFDSIPPSVTLSTDSFWITNQDVDITVTFSEQVVGFSLDDLQLSIGSWAPLVSLNDTTCVVPQQHMLVVCHGVISAAAFAGS